MSPRVWLSGDGPLPGALASLLAGRGQATHRPLGPGVQAPARDLAAEAEARSALAALGGLDALVYVAETGGFDDAGPAGVTAAATHAAAGFLARAREAVRHMARDRVAGNLVCVCDVVGVCGRAGRAASAAASGALLGMVRALAKELGRQGIAVNAVAVGPVLPDAAAGATAPGLTPAEVELFQAMGLGQPVRPEELAAVVALLAAGGHGMTGQVLRVDHGLLI